MKLPGQDQWHVGCPLMEVVPWAAHQELNQQISSKVFYTSCGMNVLGQSSVTCLAINSLVGNGSNLVLDHF